MRVVNFKKLFWYCIICTLLMELFGVDKRLVTPPHPLTGQASELICRQGCVGVLFIWEIELGNNIEAWGIKLRHTWPIPENPSGLIHAKSLPRDQWWNVAKVRGHRTRGNRETITQTRYRITDSGPFLRKFKSGFLGRYKTNIGHCETVPKIDVIH